MENEHLERIKQVLNIFKEHKLKINIEKCHFFKTEVEVLGHKISTKGLSPMDSKIEAIKKWQAPSNLHELRSFLETIGYYKNFIPNYSKVIVPLCKLLRKYTKYVWKEEQTECFEKCKEFLIDGIDYFTDGNDYRKLVTDTSEKVKLILAAHEIGHEGYFKTY